MAYWWLLERKSFKDEPIRLTPSLGEKVQAAWLQGQEKIYIPTLKTAVSASDIKSVGPSTQVMHDESIYQLASGLGDEELGVQGNGSPLLAPDYEENGVKYGGGVLWNWYKKNIDKREWDSYYSKCSWYYRLDDASGAVWVAMRVPEEQGVSKPMHLVLCDRNEIKELDKRRKS